MMRVMTQAVIFDFDGVIADSESLHLRAFQQAFAARGWTMSKADYYDVYLGYSDRDVFEVFARERGEALPSAELERLLAQKARIYAELSGAGALLFPGYGSSDCRNGTLVCEKWSRHSWSICVSRSNST